MQARGAGGTVVWGEGDRRGWDDAACASFLPRPRAWDRPSVASHGQQLVSSGVLVPVGAALTPRGGREGVRQLKVVVAVREPVSAGWPCGTSIPTHIAIKATTNAQKIQNAGVTPEVIVSPARAASADEIPNCDGATCSPSCTTAEIAYAAMAMMAPARSAAPAMIGRHRAATTTTATRAIIAARSPAITAPGLENVFPR